MSCHNEVNYIGDCNTNIYDNNFESDSHSETQLSLNLLPADQSAIPAERTVQRNLFISTSTDYSLNPILRVPRPRRSKGFRIFSSRPIVSPERSPNSVTVDNRSASPNMEQLQKFMDRGQMREQKTPNDSVDELEMLNQPCTSAIGCRDLSSDKSSIVAPIMLQADTKFSSLKSTRLLNQLISCFVVGGECRLCLQQMQALILPQATMNDMDNACRKLRIINAQANKEQIQILKMAGSLPPNAVTCELITKSNAERLIAHFLTNGSPPLNNDLREQLSFIQIAHDCFGGCSGRLYCSLAPSACIECATCLYLFQPESFCRHIHPRVSSSVAITSEPADRLCHWGFDSSNWAFYLHVDDEVAQIENSQELEDQLENFIQTYRNCQAINISPTYTQAN